MQRAALDGDIAVDGEVRVRHIDDQQIVLLLDRRAQEERPVRLQLKQEARQIAGALVVESLFPQPTRLDVAVAVEHSKAVAVFQDARMLVGDGRGRANVVRAARSRLPGRRLRLRSIERLRFCGWL